MRAPVASFCCALFLASPMTAWAESRGSLQEAVRLTQAGELLGALEAARTTPDALERAQGELYVWHHAGALREALQAGLDGLRVAPLDPWLLDRCSYLALSLGAGELALSLTEDLQAATPPESWSEKAWMMDEARALAETRAAERRSLSRARLVSSGAVLAALLGLLLASRGRGEVNNVPGRPS